jgi:glycosyltransferase involved in cell wall biosynthesis
MRIAVVIATYQRPDGKSAMYLDRTIESIDKQSFRDYHVYVVGDAYADEALLMSIVGKHPNTTCFNLDVSPERERYGFGNMKIWCAGGVTASNKGVELALADGYEYICHQAHDDLWEANHLDTINKVIESKSPLFCCTLSTYGKHILPPHKATNEIIPYYPIDGGMVASSACVKYSDTKLRVVDRFFTEGIVSPCDAYLWEQLRNELKAKGLTGYLATTITCHHDEEGYAMNRNQIK